jgi:MFS family permease
MIAAPNTTADLATDRRTVHALWGACVLGGLGQSLAGAAGALLAADVSGSDVSSGLPQAALVVGAAGSAVALSRRTLARGRVNALTTGLLVAVAGCVVVAGAAMCSSLTFVLLGSVLLGAGSTAVMLARYAAADLGPAAARGRSMGRTLAATTVGAVAGPNLLGPADALAGQVGWPGLAGPYLLAGVAFVTAGGLLAVGSSAAPVHAHRPRQPPDAPAWTVSGLAGLGVLSVANLVMVAVMTMTPLHLHHLGSSLVAIGLVISVHIAGMFAPAPVSGWLTDHVGARSTAGLAGATLAIACGLAVVADSAVAVGTAMVLLGVGWNLALLSGSALLTADLTPSQRPRREGWGEVGMGVTAGGGVAAAGPVMGMGGYGLVAGIGLAAAVCVLPLAALRVTSLRRSDVLRVGGRTRP